MVDQAGAGQRDREHHHNVVPGSQREDAADRHAEQPGSDTPERGTDGFDDHPSRYAP